MTNYIIRPYSPADRDAVRHICCETGCSGEPVDKLFRDRDVFADFFTRYYTCWEPENSFVAEVDGRVVGYLLACFRYHYHSFATLAITLGIITPKVAWRLLSGKYNKQDRSFIRWCCFSGNKETPKAPKAAAHFHFNILPEFRNSGLGYRLYQALNKRAKEKGIKKIYGQIQTFEDRRPEKVFERFGYTLFDRKEITRFRGIHDHKVFVSTFVKDFS